MSFESIMKEKFELEKTVVALTQENIKLKQIINSQTSNNIYFDEWMNKWLNKMRTMVKANTYEAYVSQVQKHIVPYFQSKKLLVSEITPEILEEYYHYMFSSGLSSSTIQKHHSNIHAALNDVVKNKIISSNPADYTDKPKAKKFVGTYLTPQQFNVVFSKLRKSKIFIPVFIAGIMGLRRSEVLGLRWSDIDYEHKTLCVQHTVVKCVHSHKSELVFSDIPKTKSSHRTLPIPDKLFEFLQFHKKRQCKYYSTNRKTYNREYIKYVCVDEHGNLISPDYLSTHFHRCMVALGYSCRFHDLRHTCASLLIQNGSPMKSVSQWLGHSSTSVTSEIYVHLTFQDKINVANAINDYLDF